MSDPNAAALRALLQRLSGAPPAAVEDALDALVEAAGPVQPSPRGLDRLRALVAAEPFAPFTRAVADLLKVTVDAARAVLRLPSDPQAWEELLPGCRLIHIPDMEHHGDADVGFVSVADGQTFPFHVHGGGERGLVLRGEILDDDGAVYGPGDTWSQDPGTSHTFLARGDLLYLVVVYEVSFPGSDLSVR